MVLSQSPRVLLYNNLLNPAQLAQLNGTIDATYPHEFLRSFRKKASRTSYSLRIGHDELPNGVLDRVRDVMHVAMASHYDYRNKARTTIAVPQSAQSTADPHVRLPDRVYPFDPSTLRNHSTALRHDTPPFPDTHLEMPKLTVYRDTEKFDIHSDASSLCSTYRDHQRNGEFTYADGVYANRIITVLLYLNTLDVNQGGATVFPALRLRVQPVAGTCLVFFPCVGEVPVPDRRTVHFAEAVRNVRPGQTKRVLQQWVWSAPYVAQKNPSSRDIVHGLERIECLRHKRLTQPSKCAPHRTHRSQLKARRTRSRRGRPAVSALTP